METLTIGKIHNKHKGYPEKDAVHMALSKLRCFALSSSIHEVFIHAIFMLFNVNSITDKRKFYYC